MAAFAQNAAQDPDTVTGWSVQGSDAQAALGIGVPAPGYAQAGITAAPEALTTSGNGQPGAPDPLPGNVTIILANPGYANVSPSMISPGTPPPTFWAQYADSPPPSGLAVQNPVALPAIVQVLGGAGATIIVATAPAGGGEFTQVGDGPGFYLLPGGGFIRLTYE